VLNYRSPRDTVRCIRSLKKQTVIREMEILLVDNKSDDESIGFFRAQFDNDPQVRIIENRQNFGFALGNNLAAINVKGEFLLIMNPDNILPPDALEKMVKVLKSRPDIGIVGPGLIYPDGTLRPSARRFPSMMDLINKRLFPAKWQKNYVYEMNKFAKEEVVTVDWLVGACLMLRTRLFRDLGGFDERYFLFFEDIDLCRRIKNLGLEVAYLPQIKVSDRKARLSGSNLLSLITKKTTRIHLTSAVKYFWKWRTGN